MADTLDEQVVELRFDNQNFEANVNQSINTIGRLKKSLDLEDAGNSFEMITEAAANCDVEPLGNSLDKIVSKFSILENAASVALGNIMTQAVNAGASLVKSMTIDQLSAGWAKYESKTQSVQTIMAATGKSIDYVNSRLEKLIWFSDETSYDFADMVNNIGKFTSAGVDLDVAVNSMMGISNWAAISGAGVQQAARAMYNLSQSIGMGYVGVTDWRSIELANMATLEFKETAIQAGVAMGQLQQDASGAIRTLSGMEVTAETMRNTLKDKWLDNDVLNLTLDAYSSFANQLKTYQEASGQDNATAAIQEMLEYGMVDESSLGYRAFRRAQEATTFTQSLAATADAVSSSWMTTFELIFGNYEKATKLWTGLTNSMWDIFASSGEKRNEALAGILNSNLQQFSDTLDNGQEFSERLYNKFYDITKENLGEDAANALISSYKSLEELLQNATLNDSTIQNGIESVVEDYKTDALKYEELIETLESGELTLKNAAVRLAKGDYGRDEETARKTVESLGFDYEMLSEYAEMWRSGYQVDWDSEQKDLVSGLRELVSEYLKAAEDIKNGTMAEGFFGALKEISGRDKLIGGVSNIFGTIKDIFLSVTTMFDSVTGGVGIWKTLIDLFYKFSKIVTLIAVPFKKLNELLNGFDMYGVHYAGLFEIISSSFNDYIGSLPARVQHIIDDIQSKINHVKTIFSGTIDRIFGEQKELVLINEDGKAETVIKRVGGLFDDLKKRILTVVSVLVGPVGMKVVSIFSAIAAYLSKSIDEGNGVFSIFGFVYDKLGAFWKMLKDIGKHIKEYVQQILPDGVSLFGGKLKLAWAWIQNKYRGLKAFFGSLFSGNSEDIGLTLDKIKKKVTYTFWNISAYIQKKARGIKAILKGLFSGNQEDREWAFHKITDILHLTDALEYTQKKIRGLKAIFSGLFSGDLNDKKWAIEKIKDILGRITKNIKASVEKVSKQIQNVFKSLWQKVGSFFSFQWLPESVRNKVLPIFQAVSKAIDPLINKLKLAWAWIQNKYRGLKAFFGSLFSGNSEDIGLTLDNIKKKVADTFGNISAYIQKGARGIKDILKGLFSGNQEDREWAFHKIAEKINTIFHDIKNSFKGSPIETFLITIENALNRIWNSAPVKGLRQMLFGDDSGKTGSQIKYEAVAYRDNGLLSTKVNSSYDQQVSQDELASYFANRDSSAIEQVTKDIEDQNFALKKQSNLLSVVLVGATFAVATLGTKFISLLAPMKYVIGICGVAMLVASKALPMLDKTSTIGDDAIHGIGSSVKMINSDVESAGEAVGPISRLEEIFSAIKNRIVKIVQTIKEIFNKLDFSEIAKTVLRITAVILLLANLPKSIDLGRFGTFGLTTALDDLAEDIHKIGVSFGIMAGSFILIALLIKVIDKEGTAIWPAIAIIAGLVTALSWLFFSVNNINVSPELILTAPAIVGTLTALIFIAGLLTTFLELGNFSWDSIQQTITIICSVLISIGIASRLMSKTLKKDEKSISAGWTFFGIGAMLIGLARFCSSLVNIIEKFKEYFDELQSEDDVTNTVYAVIATLGSILMALVALAITIKSIKGLKEDTNAKSIAAFALILFMLPRFVESIIKILINLKDVGNAIATSELNRDIYINAGLIIGLAVAVINIATWAMKSLDGVRITSMVGYIVAITAVSLFLTKILLMAKVVQSMGDATSVSAYFGSIALIIGAFSLLMRSFAEMKFEGFGHLIKSVVGFIGITTGLTAFAGGILALMYVFDTKEVDMPSVGKILLILSGAAAIISAMAFVLVLLQKVSGNIKSSDTKNTIKHISGAFIVLSLIAAITYGLSKFAPKINPTVFSDFINACWQVAGLLGAIAVATGAMLLEAEILEKAKSLEKSNFKNAIKIFGMALVALVAIGAFVIGASSVMSKVSINPTVFSDFINACWQVAGLLGAIAVATGAMLLEAEILEKAKSLEKSNFKNAIKIFGMALVALVAIGAFVIGASSVMSKVSINPTVFSDFINACWQVAGLLGAIAVAAGVMTFAAKFLSIKGGLGAIGIFAMALMMLAAIGAFVLGVSWAIPKMNFDATVFSGFIDACWKVAGLLAVMTVVMGVVGAFGIGAAPVVLVGGVVMALVLAIISGLIWFVVKISEKARELDNKLADSGGILEAINYVSSFMSALMSLFGDMVGSFFGSFAGSFADTFATYLPSIATSLSDFLAGLQPLLNSLDDLGEDHLKGAGTLVLILGAIFCAEFFSILITAISQLTNQEKMAEALNSIKTMVTDDLKPFLDDISGFNDDTITSIDNFNSVMKKLVTLRFLNSAANFISKLGTKNELGTALTNLNNLAADDGVLIEFLETAKDYGTEEQLTAIDNFSEIMKRLVSITTYEKVSSFVGSLGNDVDFGKFNTNLSTLGEAVAGFYEKVSDVNMSVVTASLSSIKIMLTLLSSDVLKSGRFITGAVSPNSVSTAFTTLLGDGETGIGIVGYLNKFADETQGHDYTNAVTAAGVISTLLNILSTKWDNLDQFVKNNKKKSNNFEKTISWIIEKLLPKLITLQSRSKELDPQRVVDIFSAIGTVFSTMSFDNCGGAGFMLWDKDTQEYVSKALAYFSDTLIPELTALDISLDGQDFSAVKTFGETISAILSPMGIEQNMSPEDIQKRLSSIREIAVSEVEKLNDALAETSSDGNSLTSVFSNISNLSVDLNSFLQIGQYVVEGLTNAFYNGDSQNAVYNAAFALGLKIKQGLMDATDENSPSKVAEQIGLFVADGLVIGLKDGSMEVKQAAAMLGLDLNRSLNKAVTQHEVNMAAYNLQDENHFNMPDFTYINRFGEEAIDFDAMRTWLHKNFDASLGPEIVDSYVGAWQGALAESEHVIQDSDYAALMGKIARGDFGLGENDIIAGLTEHYSAEADAVGLATQAYEDYNAVLDGTVKINQDLLHQQKENPPMTAEQYAEMLQKDQEAWDRLNSGELQKLATQNGTTWQEEAAKLGYSPDYLNKMAIGNYLYSRSDYEDLAIAILAEKELAETTKELKPLDELKVIPEGTAEETEEEVRGIKTSLDSLDASTQRIRPELKSEKIVERLTAKDTHDNKGTRGAVAQDTSQMSDPINEYDAVFNDLMNGAELTSEQITLLDTELYDLFNGGKLGNGVEQRAEQLSKLTGVSEEAALYFSKAFASNPADRDTFSSYVPIYKAYLDQQKAAAEQTPQSGVDIFSEWMSETIREQGIDALSDGTIELDIGSLADRLGIDEESLLGELGNKIAPDGKWSLNINDIFDGESDISKIYSMLSDASTLKRLVSKAFGDSTGSLDAFDVIDAIELFSGETEGIAGFFESAWNSVVNIGKELLGIGEDTTDINVNSDQVTTAEVSLAALRKQYELTKDTVSGEPLLAQQAYKKRQNGELLTSAEAAELQKLYNGYMVGTFSAEDLDKWGFNWADELRYWGNDYSNYVDDTAAYVDEVKADIDAGNYTIKNLMEDANAGKFGATYDIRKKNFSALGLDADKAENLFQKYLVNSEEALYNVEDNYAQLSDAEKEAIEQANHYEEVLNTTPVGAFRAISDFLNGVSKVIEKPETLTEFNTFINDVASNLEGITIKNASEFEKVANFLTILRNVANGSNGISGDFSAFIQNIEEELNGITINEEAFLPITEFFSALNAGISALDESGFTTFLHDFYGVISGDVSQASSAANTIASAIIDAFNGRKDDFIGVGAAIVQWIADSIRANTDQAIDASHTLISNIVGAFSDGLTSPESSAKLSDSLKTLFDSVMGEGEKTAQEGQKQSGSFSETMKNFGNNVVTSMAQAFSDPENIELIQNGLGQLFGITETEEGEGSKSVLSNLSEMFSTLSDGIGLVISAMDPGGAAATGSALAAGIATGVNESLEVCYAAGDALRGAFQMPGYGEGYNLGVQYAIGYANGVEAGTSGAYQSGAGVANSAMDGTADAQDSNSPSKEAYKLGAYFVQGYSNAIQDGITDVTKSAVKLGEGAIVGLAQSQEDISKSAKTITESFGLDKMLLGTSALDKFKNYLVAASHGFIEDPDEKGLMYAAGEMRKIIDAIPASQPSISVVVDANTAEAEAAIDSFVRGGARRLESTIAFAGSIANQVNKDITSKVSVPASVTTNNYNFTQTNNSPKALKPIDVYRGTRTLLAKAQGGGGRMVIE